MEITDSQVYSLICGPTMTRCGEVSKPRDSAVVFPMALKIDRLSAAAQMAFKFQSITIIITSNPAVAVHYISSLRVCISTRFRPSSHPCIHPPACFLFGAFEMSCSHFILISYTTVPNATDKNRHGLKWCYNVYRLKECQCLDGMSSTDYNFGKWHVSAS